MAQTNLGILYETGVGVGKNFDAARIWYEKAAAQGDARGQTYLGRMYELGIGVEKDFRKAFYWYNQAAEQSYARAQTNIGALYEAGQGVEQNYTHAAVWYKKAADQSYARGQFYLGRLFELGLGVEKDLAQASNWYFKAAAQDYDRAREQLAAMELEYGKTGALTIREVNKGADELPDKQLTGVSNQEEEEEVEQMPVHPTQPDELITKLEVMQEPKIDRLNEEFSSQADNMDIAGWQTLAKNSLAELGKPVELDGIIEPLVITDVGTPVEGVVQDVMVERSNVVKTGQLLIKLDSTVEKALVDKARSRANNYGEIELQKEKLAFAERAHERINELFIKQAISDQQKDEAYTEVTIARQRLQKAEEERKLAELELKQAEALLAQRYVKSPISGIVVERFISKGEFVDNQPLLRIAQIDPLRIEVIVPSHMFGKIKPGMKATVLPELQEFGNQAATVTIVDRVIDAASNSFAVRLEMPNPDYIIPSGLKCSVQFMLEPAASLASMNVEERPSVASATGDQPVPTLFPSKTKTAKRHVVAER